MDKLNDVLADPKRLASLRRRFEQKVHQGRRNECWLWPAKSRNDSGYGRITSGRGTHLRAHRVAWALANGRPIPTGMCVLHRCDNPPCCNPAHLFVGTKQDNTQDMLKKGRNVPPPRRYGELHHATKFDAATVREIASDQRVAHEVAAEYGISSKTVYRVRRRTTWVRLWEARQ